jgi:hypothetical protein
MSISAALLPFVALFALAQSAIDLRLSPERVTVRPGQPLELVLTITNRSGQSVGVITPNLQNEGQRPYYFELLSSPDTVLEVESREFPIGHNETLFPGVSVIEAGSSFKRELTVNGPMAMKGNYYRVQGLSLPGRYLLRLRYHPERAACSTHLATYFGPKYLDECGEDLKKRIWVPGGFIVSNSVAVVVTARSKPGKATPR